MTHHNIPEDLSIPAFPRTTSAGTPHITNGVAVTVAPTRPAGFGTSCWEETRRPSDIVAVVELRAAVKQYEDEKRFAARQQWEAENPGLARMQRQAKRDTARRIAKLGIPPASRRSR